MVRASHRELYLDDGGHHHLRIYAGLSLPRGVGAHLERFVEDQVLPIHRARLGNTFQQFHASQLRWDAPMVAACEELLRTLLETIWRQGGRLVVTIDSRRALKGSPEFVRGVLEPAIRQLAVAPDESAIQALLAETELVWWLAKRGHLLADDGEVVAVIAHERGSAVRRLGEPWLVRGDRGAVLKTRPEMLALLANVLASVPQICPTNNPPRFRTVRAVNSRRFFCVQACDLVASLMLAFLRELAGSPAVLDREKSAMLTRYVDFTVAPGLRDSLTWTGAEVMPKDDCTIHSEVRVLPA